MYNRSVRFRAQIQYDRLRRLLPESLQRVSRRAVPEVLLCLPVILLAGDPRAVIGRISRKYGASGSFLDQVDIDAICDLIMMQCGADVAGVLPKRLEDMQAAERLKNPV